MQDKPKTARFGTTLFLDNPLHRQAWEILFAIPAGQRIAQDGVGDSVRDPCRAAHELALSGTVSAGTAGAISEGLKSNSPSGAAKQLRSTSNFAAAASRERRR